MRFIFMYALFFVCEVGWSESIYIVCKYSAEEQAEPNVSCEKMFMRARTHGSAKNMEKVHLKFIRGISQSRPNLDCDLENRTDRLELRYETNCTNKLLKTVVALKTIWPRDTRSLIYFRKRKMGFVERQMRHLISIRDRNGGKLFTTQSLYQ